MSAQPSTLAVLLEQCLAPVPGGTGRYAAEIAEALAASAPDGWRVAPWTAYHSDVAAARVVGAEPPRRLELEDGRAGERLGERRDLVERSRRVRDAAPSIGEPVALVQHHPPVAGDEHGAGEAVIGVALQEGVEPFPQRPVDGRARALRGGATGDRRPVRHDAGMGPRARRGEHRARRYDGGEWNRRPRRAGGCVRRAGERHGRELRGRGWRASHIEDGGG